MKQIIVMMLCISITEILCAQLSLNRRTHKEEEMKNFSRSYFLDLKTCNSMQVDIYDQGSTPIHPNIDSLMQIALSNYEVVKDSLGDPSYARTLRIRLYDTVLQSVGWQSDNPHEKRILLYGQDTTLVKFAQDTVLLEAFSIVAYNKRNPPYVKIKLVLNDVDNLSSFVTGRYNTLFNALRPDDYRLWGWTLTDIAYLKSNPDLQMLKAYNPDDKKVTLRIKVSISAQNYMQRFVPSINTNMGITVLQYNRETQYWLGYEADFTFSKDANQKSQIFANGFITLAYKLSNFDPRKAHSFTVHPNIKLGYLCNRRDLLYDKNNFKLGIAEFMVGEGNLRIEPTFYFTDLFHRLSPSFRITQAF